jgi:signal transduction histidine kinase
LIDQLLDLTRLQANTLAIEPVERTLESVIDVARVQLEILTGEHNLRFNLPERLPLVLADAQRLAQVLVNLVGNAAKYSPAGTQITIEAQESGDVVQVSVRDEGPGIPEEAHDYVFEAFRQVEIPGVMRSRGAGLGLAISKAIIEGHGGSIWIDGENKSGATIVFTLPIARTE